MTTTGMTPTEKHLIPIDQQNNGEENEEKIVQEFSHLLDKSKQLFNGLR